MTTPSRYWREIPQRYRLEANKCKSCKTVYFPPRLLCPECKKSDLVETKLVEKGEVVSYTIIRVPPQQFIDQTPYAIGIIKLDDGVNLMGQIVDCDFEDLKIGMRVRIEFRKIFNEGEAGILCYGYKFVPE